MRRLNPSRPAAALIAAGVALASGLAFAAADELRGALLYNTASQVVRLDLASRRESSAPLPVQTTDMIGYGAGLVSALEVQPPNRYRLKLLHGDAFAAAKTLPPFTISKGHASGRVQPSPDGALFAVQTRESAGLGEPNVDHVYVFDGASHVTMRVVGYRDPVWLNDRQLLMAGDDGLFAFKVGAPSPRRIGTRGAAPQRPAVSPDGRAIAFVQGDAIWRVGIDGSALQRLTLPRAGQTWPAWSPDGARVVVVRRACPPVGGASPDPELVIVSATRADQDIERLPLVMRSGNRPARSCGPVYWTP